MKYPTNSQLLRRSHKMIVTAIACLFVIIVLSCAPLGYNQDMAFATGIRIRC